MLDILAQEETIVIKQRREMVELFGFETRNKYEIFSGRGHQIGFAAEQQKGFLGAIFRQILRHWRTFDIHIYDINRQHQFVAHHPFRFYFDRLDVRDVRGQQIGHMEKQFSILTKKFQVFDRHSRISAQMSSGLFKIWTFPFTRNGREIARISKKWGGMLKEVFLDADNFVLQYLDSSLTAEERAVLLSAALFVDLLYFEGNNGS